MTIKARRISDGKVFECTYADQERIRELTVANGGDLMAALRQQFEEKHGEPMEGDNGKRTA